MSKKTEKAAKAQNASQKSREFETRNRESDLPPEIRELIPDNYVRMRVGR